MEAEMVNAGDSQKQELANEEESAAQAAADSRPAELDQAMAGLTCTEGPGVKKRRVDMAGLTCTEGPGVKKRRVDMSPASLLCPHTPSNPQRADVAKYMFFEASWAGCLGCVKKLLEARPGLISEASYNQGYTGLTWAEFGVEKGRVECQQVVEYLKVKKRELANEEASAAQVAGGSRSADLDQAMDGLTCAEGLVFKKLHAMDGLCMRFKQGFLTRQEFEMLKQELLGHTP